jgi:hypothetical protein
VKDPLRISRENVRRAWLLVPDFKAGLVADIIRWRSEGDFERARYHEELFAQLEAGNVIMAGEYRGIPQ